ncbi:MAG: PHP domain-containing protein [Chloroflexota bacterium]|nr:PHP domain-containing protein [Chloroflexota bacterium]
MTDATATAAPTLTIPGDAAVDLHLHTHASDGAWTPEGLVAHLVEKGFRVVCVCDHDTQWSVPEVTRLGSERGLHVVPGVEVTTRWADRQWHLLVYGIAPDRTDASAAPFRAVLAETDAELRRLAADARDRYEAAGKDLPSLADLHADRPMWPYHVLMAAIGAGHVKDLKEAAETLVSLGGGFSADQPLERVVEVAHLAGGVCVVAHPGRSDSVGVMTAADLDRMLETIPLDGLEGHYRSYTDEQTALYRGLAADRGMLVSCGSDSHAPGKPVDPRPWQARWCADLLARLGVMVEPDDPGGRAWACGRDPLAVVPEPEKLTETAPAEPGDGSPVTDPPAEVLAEVETERSTVPA